MTNLLLHHINYDLGTILVEFCADWCIACKKMETDLDNLQKEINGLKIIRINVDEQRVLAREIGIKVLPTFILLRNGRIEGQTLGSDINKVIGMINNVPMEIDTDF